MMVAAVTEVWRPQPAHSNVQALVSSCQALPPSQPGQTNPSGQRVAIRYCAHAASSPKRCWNSIKERGKSVPGEADRGALRLDFDRRLMLQFHGSAITSDARLLAYRKLDDALSPTETSGDVLSDKRTGRNGRHRLAGLLRQSVFGGLAGYEDVNDSDRLCRDPAMRWVVGDRGGHQCAASASQMGRFETKWLS
jgi:hypothetical protein